MFRPPVLARLLWPSAAVAVALIALFVAYAPTPPLVMAVGDQDSLVFRGLHAVETAGPLTYRWTSPTSLLTLPQVGQSSATLQLELWLPASQPPTRVTLAGERGAFLVMNQQGLRTATMLVPRNAIGNGGPTFRVDSPIWNAAGDPRPIGIAVTRLYWDGLGSVMPPLRQLWVIPALVLAILLLLSRLGFGMPVAAGCAALVGSLLAIACGRFPLEVAPYTHRILLFVVLSHVGLVLWQSLFEREKPGWLLPRRLDPISLLGLMGLAYWLVLPFEWLLSVEMGSSVAPRPGLRWIGPIVFTLVLLVALLPRLPARLRRNSVLTIIVLSAVASAIYAASFSFRRSGPDFFIHWRAAFDFNLGRPLYKVDEIRANHFGHAFKLPPFDAMIFLPFATSDDNLVLLGHRIMNCLLYLGSGGLLAWFLRPQLGWPAALAAVTIVMGLMQPAFDTIAYGQTDIIVLALLVIGLAGIRSRRVWLTGWALALGIIIKLYLLLWVGLLIIRREWRALFWLLVGFVALNGLAIGVMGWHNHVVFVTEVLPILGGGSSWVENQTINGFLSRLLTDTLRTDPIRDPLINRLTYLAFAILAAPMFLFALAPSQRRSAVEMLQWSAFGIVMALAIPSAWMHYATTTILAFVGLVWFTADVPISMRKAVLLALAFALISFGNQWSFFDGTRHPGLPELALSYKAYGMVLLWGVLCATFFKTWNARQIWHGVRSWLPLRSSPTAVTSANR